MGSVISWSQAAFNLVAVIAHSSSATAIPGSTLETLTPPGRRHLGGILCLGGISALQKAFLLHHFLLLLLLLGCYNASVFFPLVFFI